MQFVLTGNKSRSLYADHSEYFCGYFYYNFQHFRPIFSHFHIFNSLSLSVKVFSIFDTFYINLLSFSCNISQISSSQLIIVQIISFSFHAVDDTGYHLVEICFYQIRGWKMTLNSERVLRQQKMNFKSQAEYYDREKIHSKQRK